MTDGVFAPLKWDAPLNPKDTVDYSFPMVGKILETGETVNTWDLVLSAESIAAGLVLGTGPYAPVLAGTTLTFWFSIDPAHQADDAFEGTGVYLDMVLSVTTNNAPPRIRDRTLLLRVCRQ